MVRLNVLHAGAARGDPSLQHSGVVVHEHVGARVRVRVALEQLSKDDVLVVAHDDPGGRLDERAVLSRPRRLVPRPLVDELPDGEDAGQDAHVQVAALAQDSRQRDGGGFGGGRRKYSELGVMNGRERESSST